MNEPNLDDVEKVLQEIKSLDFLQQEVALKKLSETTGLTLNALRGRLQQLSKKKEAPKMEMSEAESEEAMKFLKEKDILEEFSTDFAHFHIGDKELAQHHLLSGVNLGLKGDSIHINASGKSGKGKSSMQKKVAQFFTKNAILNDVSPKALQYRGEVDQYIIVIDDADLKNPDKLSLLRSITSNEEEKAITSWTIIDQEFAELEAKGKIAVWLSNVDVAKNPQTANRFAIDRVDESREQDKKVHTQQRNDLAGGKNYAEKEKILNRWRNITDILLSERDDVIAPFSMLELEVLVWNNESDRRLFPIFATIVRAITKAYKYQREKDKNGRLISTREDFERAIEIWNKIGEASATKLSETAEKVYKALKNEEQTISEIAKSCGFATSTTRYNLQILEEKELANSEQDQAGRKAWKYWLSSVLPQSTIVFEWNKLKLDNIIKIPMILECIPNITDIYTSLIKPVLVVRSEKYGQSIAKEPYKVDTEGSCKVDKVEATDSEKRVVRSDFEASCKVKSDSEEANLTIPYNDLTKPSCKVETIDRTIQHTTLQTKQQTTTTKYNPEVVEREYIAKEEEKKDG
jgi:hypothetical protein